MNELKIYYPFKPFVITQHWGVFNPSYAEQFNDPNFRKHNGLDANTGKFDWKGKIITEFPVYCPAEGLMVHAVKYQPNGGGHYMILVSEDKVTIGGVECYAMMYLLHAKKILVPVGYKPKLGELLMIGNNSGFSTGPHTHIGLYRAKQEGGGYKTIDSNEANNSYNPLPLMTGKYAVDEANMATLVKSGLRYYKYVLGG